MPRIEISRQYEVPEICRKIAMQHGSSSVLLLITIAGAALFVWLTSRPLPAIVASHFDASGAANGFMPHTFYVCFMFALIIGLPLLTTFLSSAALNKPDARINIPNRDYWLAPERRADTVACLKRQLARFWSMLVILLCYMHWVVVRANVEVPPHLSSSWFMGGLAVFVIFVVVWAMLFVGRFRNIPE